MGRGLFQLRSWSYRNKLLACFITITVIPVILISSICYATASALTEHQVERVYWQSVSIAVNSVEERCQQISLVLDLISQDPRITQIVSGSQPAQSPYEDFLSYRNINNYLDFLEQNFNLFDIRMYVEKEGGEGSHFRDTSALKEIPGMERDLEEYWGTLSWKSTVGQSYYLPNQGAVRENVYSGVRVINNYYRKTFSCCFVDIREEELYEIIGGLAEQNAAKAYLLDREGTIVSAAEKPLLGATYDSPVLEEILSQPDSIIKSREFLTLHQKVPGSELTLMLVLPLEVIRGELDPIRNVAYLLCILAVIASVGMSVVVSNGLTRKLSYLFTAMRKTEDKNFEGLLPEISRPVNGEDEVDQLIGTYNYMVKRINTLIEEVYQTKLQESELRLKMLQAQINPHFLYNILETIKSSITARDNEQAVKLVLSLSQFYRLALSQGREKIKISRELEMVCAYMEMQKATYGDRITLDIRVDEDVYDCLMIKFTLQPLVENCIKHGFCRGGRSGSITICGGNMGDYLQIQVMDDGVGIEEENLKKIQEALAQGIVPEGKGFGLYNVNQRLGFYQKQDCGISIFSEVGKGTIVELTFPRET